MTSKKIRQLESRAKANTLCFRLLHDPELDLPTRIIYAWLWKWKDINFLSTIKPKNWQYKPITHLRLRSATGFYLPTIRKSMATLKERGYLDGKLEPFQKHPAIMYSDPDPAGKRVAMYRSIKLRGSKKIKRVVATAFIIGTTKKVAVNYHVTALGISRRTVLRLLKAIKTPSATVKTGSRVGTVGSRVGTLQVAELAPSGSRVGTVGSRVGTVSNTVQEIPAEEIRMENSKTRNTVNGSAADVDSRFNSADHSADQNRETVDNEIVADDYGIADALDEILNYRDKEHQEAAIADGVS